MAEHQTAMAISYNKYKTTLLAKNNAIVQPSTFTTSIKDLGCMLLSVHFFLCGRDSALMAFLPGGNPLEAGGFAGDGLTAGVGFTPPGAL